MPKQPQPARNLTGASALFFVAGATLPQQCADIPIPKPVQRKFPSADGLQQTCVLGRKGIESAIAPPIALNRLAHLLGPFKERNGPTGRSQRLEIALVTGAADLSPSADVGHGAAQDAPSLGLALSGVAPFDTTPDPKLLGTA